MYNFSKFAAIFLLVLSATLISATSLVSASATIPNFPVCTNPQGTVKASYASGTHGIVGSTANYTGSDVVYQLSPDSLMQCFCAESGDGIQTNWWKISQLSEEEVDNLVKLGWIYVPNGALWGLDPVAYLAKNMDFKCPANGGSNSSSGNGGSSNNSSSGSASSANANLASVLGLASTGNNTLFYLLPFIGIISLIIGFILKRKSAK